MSRKMASVRTKKSGSTKKSGATATARKAESSAKSTKKKKKATARPVSCAASPAKKTGRPAPLARRAKPVPVAGALPEGDVTTAIESVSRQIGTAVDALAELAAAHGERDQTPTRPAPLDRAAASFQRLVNEVMDDQLAELLPPLVALRNEMALRAANDDPNDSSARDLCQRGTETLDHVLALAQVERYEARVGETCDPLIHLAVKETNQDDLADGAVAASLQPGFRTRRGKVVAAARVTVNRRG